MSTTRESEFINNIINDPICIPSKTIRDKLSSLPPKYITSEMMYMYITQSMHSLKDKYKLLKNLLKFTIDYSLIIKINTYIKIRKNEYANIKQNKDEYGKYVYNVYSMRYRDAHNISSTTQIMVHRGHCNEFIGTVSSLDNAHDLIMLYKEKHLEEEKKYGKSSYFEIFYRVSKTKLYNKTIDELHESFGELFYDRNGELVDLHPMSLTQFDDCNYNNIPISTSELIDLFGNNKMVKIYNSIYTMGLSDAVQIGNYIIGYTDIDKNNISFYNNYITIKDDKDYRNAEYKSIPMQYVELCSYNNKEDN